MELSAFIQLNAGDEMALFTTAEIFLEVKNIPQRAGYIQFFRIDYSFHKRGARLVVKIENKFLI